MPCVLPTRFTREGATRLLGSRDQIYWLDGDRLTLIARFGPEGWGLLCCAIQHPLEPIGDTGLGAITVRVPRVREALIDAGMSAEQTAYPPANVATPDAPPPPPRAAMLQGSITRHLFHSSNLGGDRLIKIYMPPEIPPDARLPVIYLADGGTDAFAPILEEAIRNRSVAPVILVGIDNGHGPAPGCTGGHCDRRMFEYVITTDSNASAPDSLFNRHMRFVTDEVMPWVERNMQASPDAADHIAAGYSNGGAWAVTAAVLRPDRFGKVLAMSIAGGPWPETHAAGLSHARLFAGAGTFEESFLPHTRRVADAAARAGAEVRMREIVSGHSMRMWDILLVEGAAWLLPNAAPGR
jgi:enterochelin esterase-like enzyme